MSAVPSRPDTSLVVDLRREGPALESSVTGVAVRFVLALPVVLRRFGSALTLRFFGAGPAFASEGVATVDPAALFTDFRAVVGTEGDDRMDPPADPRERAGLSWISISKFDEPLARSFFFFFGSGAVSSPSLSGAAARRLPLSTEGGFGAPVDAAL